MVWPGQCACCGDDATTALPPTRGLFRSQPTERVPYCEPCSRHVGLWTDGSKQASQIGIGGWGLGVVIYMITHSPAGSAVFAVSLVAAIGAAHRARTAARAAVGPRCAEAAPAVAQIAGGFQFTSERYALAFAGENRERLLSTSPALRRQLELPRAVVVTRRGDPEA